MCGDPYPVIKKRTHTHPYTQSVWKAYGRRIVITGRILENMRDQNESWERFSRQVEKFFPAIRYERHMAWNISSACTFKTSSKHIRCPRSLDWAIEKFSVEKGFPVYINENLLDWMDHATRQTFYTTSPSTLMSINMIMNDLWEKATHQSPLL